MKTEHIYQGDCNQLLWNFPDGSIDCVVTSPPYWNLRDYEEEDQLGLEECPIDYVQKLVNIFKQIRRF